LIPTERFKLATVAIRVGHLRGPGADADSGSELAAIGGGKSVRGYMVENAIAMANLYLDRQNLGAAAKMLDAAYDHMAGERNTYTRRDYAVARGQLELTQGHPEAAESMLRDAVIEEERLAARPSRGYRPCPAGSCLVCCSGRSLAGAGPFR